MMLTIDELIDDIVPPARPKSFWCRLGLHWPKRTLRDGYLVLTWQCSRCGRIGYAAQFEGW